eukprot:TRINITY_DN137_c0_g2_i9.p2 TRINITY_DN137_c0_g2~~TRINITY_DN137_c0_g2_i9.p2  ORF type:complete len:100 (+),score=49.35 TRINITY_DN137_c0_g2_i9:48-302(+)
MCIRDRYQRRVHGEIKLLQIQQIQRILAYMPNKLFRTHQRTYGKDSRACKRCGARQGLIRKYEMNVCRRCFREFAKEIGFTKYR